MLSPTYGTEQDKCFIFKKHFDQIIFTSGRNEISILVFYLNILKFIKKWKWKNKVFEDKKNHAFNLDDIISTFFWLKMAAFVKIHDILKKNHQCRTCGA